MNAKLDVNTNTIKDMQLEALDRRLLLATIPVTSYLTTPFEALTGGAGPAVNTASTGQSDDFTFETFYDGKVSVAVRPLDPSLTLRVSYDGLTQDGAAGEPVVLRNVARPAGPESVTVEVLGGGGDYQVEVVSNTDLEAESFGGAQNNTPGNAQAIDASAIPLGSGDRLAVTGRAADGEADVFSFDAAAGQVVSLLAEGPVRFEILDPAGNAVVDAARADGGFVQQFRPTAAGTHFVRVVGEGAGEYRLAIGRGVQLDAGTRSRLDPGVDAAGFARVEGSSTFSFVEQEPNDTIFDADDADPRGGVAIAEGSIDPTIGDVDLFYVGFVDGSDVLEVELEFLDGFGDADLVLFDADGNDLAYGDYDFNGEGLFLFFDAEFEGFAGGDLYVATASPSTFIDPFNGGDGVDEYGDVFDYELYVGLNGALGGGSEQEFNDTLFDANNAIPRGGVTSVTGFVDAFNEDVDFFYLGYLEPTDRIEIDLDAVGFGDSTLTLFDSNGNELAFSDDDAPAGEAGSGESYIDFNAAGAPGFFGDDVYVAVTAFGTDVDPFDGGSGFDEYGGGFDYELFIALNGATVEPEGDLYDLTVQPGETLTLTADRPALSDFFLDVALELYDETGTLVASADASSATAAPGETLTYTVPAAAPADARYTVAVRTVDGFAPYLVRADGTSAATGGRVLGVSYDDPYGEFLPDLPSFPAQVTVVFSDALRLDTIDAADLRVIAPGGAVLAPTGVTRVGGNVLVFDTLGLPTGAGEYELRIEPADVRTADGRPLAATFSETFTFTDLAPRVTSSSILPGDVLEAGSVTYRATFSQPLRTSVSAGIFGFSVLTSDDVLLVDAVTGERVDVSITSFGQPDGEDFFVEWTGDLPEGIYEMRLLADDPFNTDLSDFGNERFQSEDGVALDGGPSFPLPSGDGTAGDDFVIDFSVERSADAPMPAFSPVDPIQSGIYTTEIAGAVIAADDVDGFTLDVIDGSPISLRLEHLGGAGRFEVTVRNPDGSTAAVASADAAGGDVELPTLTFDAGAVGIEVRSLDGGLGAYRINAAYSATLAEAGGTAATALDVAPTLVGYANGSGRYGALGEVSAEVRETRLVAAGPFELYEPLAVEFPAGPDPVGDVTYRFERSGPSNSGLFASVEGIVSGSVGTLTLTPEQYREAAADGVVRVSVRPDGSRAFTDQDVTVVQQLPEAGDADVYRVPAVAGEEIALLLDGIGGGDVYASLTDSAGNVLAGDEFGGSVSGGLRQRVATFVPGADGEVFVRVVGDGGYSLAIGRDTGIRPERFDPQHLIGPSGKIVEDLRFGSATSFRFFAEAGDTVTLETATPETPGGNTLDPNLGVTSPSGSFIVGDADSGEGDNARASFIATETGYHTVRVNKGGPGEGLFTLTITGLAAEETGPSVAAATPAGAAAGVDGLLVRFDEPVQSYGLDPAALQLDNGVAATAARLLDAHTVRYDLSGSGSGVVSYILAAGAVTDVYGNPSAAYAGSFELDTTGPVLVGPEPAQVGNPFRRATFVFDDPIDPASFDRSDLLSFTGPGGQDLLNQVFYSRVEDGGIIALEFGTQTEPGEYTFTFSPKLRNTLGLLADQDGDGVGGEPVDDLIVATVLLSDPDLSVTAASAPDTLRIGESFDVEYTVQNVGPDPVTTNWTDAIYLQRSPTFNPNSSSDVIRFVNNNDNLPLPAGASYTRTEAITIALGPKYTPGTYYLFVETDSGARVTEQSETNNLVALGAVTLLAPELPNLRVTGVTGPAAAVSGETVDVTWTLRNDGDRDFVGTFSERIEVSYDDAIGDDVFIRTVEFTGSLPVGGSVTRTATVPLPVDAEGDVRFVVTADAGDVVEEYLNEDDNAGLQATPTTVTLAPQVDLVPTGVLVPAAAESGQTFVVRYTLRNDGSADFDGTFSDQLFLSPDAEGTSLESLGTFSFTGSIPAGSAVQRTVDVTLPIDLDEDRFLIVRSDAFNNVVEVNGEDNNTAVSPAAINITLAPQPDLTVSDVDGPESVFSGTTTTVSWVVTNDGTADTNASVWYDEVYLSFDQEFNGGDRFLGRARNAAFLRPGESYASSLDVEIPVQLAGTYYLLVRTDTGNNVTEVGGEDNNLGVSGTVDVQLTPPPDLTVGFSDTPNNVFSGQPTLVRLRIDNLGETRAGGSTTRVWLSDDETLGGDTLLKNIPTAGVDGNGSLLIEEFVTLPVGVSGPKFLIFEADAFGQIFEGPFEDNNVTAEAVNVLLTPPPDLVVTSISAPTGLVAGKTAQVSLSVENQGSTVTPNGFWDDAVFLSDNDRLDPGDRRIGTRRFTGRLAPGESYDAVINVSVPVDAEGAKFLIVRADYATRVFEIDRDNNVVPAAVDIDPQLPNLAPTSVTVPASVVTGTSALVEYTVTNDGVGDTRTGRWTDRIYLSTDGQLGGDILLASVDRTQLVGPGESYDVARYVAIPQGIDGGDYQILVCVDNNRRVFEADEADNLAARPVRVVQDLPNLVVTDLTTTDPARSGLPVGVQFTTANLGGGETQGRLIEQSVYLSTDAIFDTTDEFIGVTRYYDNVTGGEDFTRGLSFTPQVPGDYFLLVRTDTRNNVPEGAAGEADNLFAQALTIEPGPTADLVVADVVADNEGFAGREIDVAFTVRNDGDLATGFGSYVQFYLSADTAYDSGDRTLGYASFAALDAGASFDRTTTLRLPAGVTGDWFVVARVDPNNNIPERGGELNNAAADPAGLSIDLAPPVDLVAGPVPMPGDAFAGQLATLTYSVTNAGPQDVVGTWTDSVYISADPVWDVNDPLFAEATLRYNAGDPLAAGESYTRSVTAPLPGLPVGDYHVIVRSDILNFVVETDEDNNAAASVESFEVDVPALTLGVPEDATVAGGRFVYYRVDVAADQTLLVDLDARSYGGATELYVKYGGVASRNDFDFAYDSPLQRDQRVVVPNTEAGTYYITAFVAAVRGVTSSDIRITADLVPFGLLDNNVGVGGNAGLRTVELNGARFDRSVTATLVAGGVEVPASDYYRVDESRLFATFDLRGVAAGEYGLRLEKPSTGETELTTGAFTVVEAALPSSASFDGVTPGRARPGNPTPLTMSWGNRGLNDVAAPVLRYTDTGDGYAFSSANTPRRQLTFVGLGEGDGPVGTLLPGEASSVTLTSVGGRFDGDHDVRGFVVSEDPDAVVDLETVREETRAFRPEWAREDFDAAFDLVAETVGRTWGTLTTALAESANRLPVRPQVAFVQELLAYNLDEAYATLAPSITGRVGADSFRVGLSGRTVLATNLDTGERFSTSTLRDGTFRLLDVTPGEYRLRVADGLQPDETRATVTAEASALDVAVTLVPGATLRATVLGPDGGPVQADARLIDGPAGVLLGADRGEPDGTVSIGGLAVGEYRVAIEAEGLARRVVTFDVATAGERVDVNATLDAESSVTGTLSLNGRPVTTADLLAVVNVDGEPGYVAETGVGAFRVGHLPAGTYGLTLKVDGSLARTVQVTVAAGEELDLGNVDLTEAATVAGAIVTNGVKADAIVLELLRGGEVVASGTFDVADAFVFGELAAGTYEVRVADGSGIAAPLSFTLAEGDDLAGLTLQVFPGGTITGTTRVNGVAAGGVEVYAVDTATGTTFATRSAADGSYTLTALMVGSYAVSAVAGSGASNVVSLPTLDTTAAADLNVAAVATVGGTLLGPDGQPLAGATVTLAAAGDAASASIETDALGRWSFAVLTAGTYTIAGRSDLAGVTPRTIAVADGDDLDVTLNAGGSTLTVTTAGGDARVVLAAVDGPTLTALAGREVTAGTSAAFGSVAAGTYRVFIGYADGRVSVRDVTVGGDDVTLAAGAGQDAEVAGTVVDPDGDAVAGGVVTLLDPATGDVAGTGVILPDGRFAVDAAAGTYDVILTSEGLGSTTLAGVALAGDANGLTLTPSTTVVNGRLVAGGVAVAGGDVVTLDADGNVVGLARVGVDGAFRLVTTPAAVTLEVSRPGYASASVALPGGDVGDVAVTPTAVGVTAPVPQAAARLFNEQLSGLIERLNFSAISRATLGLPTLEVPRSIAGAYTLPPVDQIAEDCPGCLDEWFRVNAALELEPLTVQQAVGDIQNYNQAANDALLTFTARAAKLGGAFGAAGAAILALGGAASIAAAGETALVTVGGNTLTVGGGLTAAGILDSLNFIGGKLIDLLNPAPDPGAKAAQTDQLKNDLLDFKSTYDAALNALGAFLDSARGVGEGVANVAAGSAILGGLVELGEEIFNDKLFTDMSEALKDADRIKNTAETTLDNVRRDQERVRDTWYQLQKCLVLNCDDEPDWEDIQRTEKWRERLTRIRSSDPNDILGPDGYGDSRFVTADEILGYRIRFENEPTATAPAQFIRITNTLDPSLDPRSFRLGDLAFWDVTVDVPDDVAFFQTRLDLTETEGFLVDVTAGIDVVNGEAFWELETIDPATGRRPVDPTIGLLPINDDTGIGEGYVDYRVRARDDAATGAEVVALAEIIFDLNAPIITPEWRNTIDADGPSSVAAAPAGSAEVSFEVTWAGADPDGGSGLAGYTIYVSTDGGAYRPWLIDTTLTGSTYVGVAGRTYAFAAVARDNAGNVEALPAAADAVVQVEGTSVVGRHVFYNHSAFDDADPAANAADDAAIAADKAALLPGNKASFANYTSYSRGINGVMVDIAGLPAGTLTAADFAFALGNDDTPGDWTQAPAPASVTVRRGAGVDGADRVTLTWADGAIAKTWLQVTVLANANTGLAEADVFYFGNAPGETGDATTNAVVNAGDVVRVRQNLSGFSEVGLDSLFDFDRDGRVGAGDVVIARENLSGFTPLRLIDLRGSGDAPLGRPSIGGPVDGGKGRPVIGVGGRPMALGGGSVFSSTGLGEDEGGKGGLIRGLKL